MAKIDLSSIKALSKEQRISMAALVRKDPELWNAINGLGGLSEKSENGIVLGGTTANGEVLANVAVSLKSSTGEEKTTLTNQYGFFKLEVVPDTQLITFKNGSVLSEAKTIELQKGVTINENYDFVSV